MTFLLLLVIILVISIIVSGLVILFFQKPIAKMLTRIVGEEIAQAWQKFLTFALLVIGISSGVAIWRLERFVQPSDDGTAPLTLTNQVFGLEIYNTIISTLGGMAWALFIFFVVALIAFVIVKRKEAK
ncbi:MAG: hypothetical protein GXO93_09125 [FCB group bacterium]|nr:hypothetical protein [FCB group bacterium]